MALQTDNLVYEVEDILDCRLKKDKRTYKIRWKGCGPDDDTWEPEENLNCPDKLREFHHKERQSRVARSTRTSFSSPLARNPVGTSTEWTESKLHQLALHARATHSTMVKNLETLKIQSSNELISPPPPNTEKETKQLLKGEDLVDHPSVLPSVRKVGLTYKLGLRQYFKQGGWLLFLLVLVNVLIVAHSAVPNLFASFATWFVANVNLLWDNPAKAQLNSGQKEL